MMFPLNHGVMSAANATESSYPVTTGLVGLWDWKELDGLSNGEGFSSFPDASGNGNDLTCSGPMLYYDAGYVDTNLNRGEAFDILGGLSNIKTTPFSMVIRVHDTVSNNSDNRLTGFNINRGAELLYGYAADNTIRFNNGNVPFTGKASPPGTGTYCFVNHGDGTITIYVDGVLDTGPASIPTGDVPDIFEVGRFGWESQFVFAALHDVALNDAEIAAIHNYAIGA